ncbi:filamentous hemagglutinin domain protein [Bordetella holmesii 70147]|nr:filamentous hemagglutinin domain protein [Bordetella holmesii 70147]
MGANQNPQFFGEYARQYPEGQAGGIRAGGDIDINQQQHKGKKARVYNEGAIVAGAQLRVDGNVENRSKGKSLSVMDYLRQNTGGFSTRVEEVALPSGTMAASRPSTTCWISCSTTALIASR